jgi:apolipoprotein N-acyltransferase
VPGGFTPGLERRRLDIPGLPGAAPLICYEAIFPGEILPQDGRPVGFLVNVTNDAWFGLTSGPYQHLAQARLRTIEEGLPLVRAANSGISAVIDPFGRLVASLPLGVEAVLDAELPRAIAPPPYARLGDTLFWVLILASVVAAFRLHRPRALARR